MSVVVYHSDDETAHDVIDGRLYSVPPDTPFEFASTFIGRKFIEHKHYHGVVEVKTIRTRNGITFDLEDAEKRSKELLHHADMSFVNQYLESQQTDRLERGKPPVRAVGRYAKVIKRHNINLADYGINPIGTLEGNAKIGTDPVVSQMQQQMVAMQNLLVAFISGGGITPANADQLKEAMAAATPKPQGEIKRIEVPEEKPFDAALGEATEGSEGLPGNDDGILDLSKAYSAFGTTPDNADDPNTLPGARVEGRGNMNSEQVATVISQIKPPARKGK